MTAEPAAARARSFWLLARLLGEQPDRGMLLDIARGLAAIAGGELSAELHALAVAVRRPLGSAQALTELQVEYTRLLAGVSRVAGLPPPYESAALDGAAFGSAAQAVAECYAAAGQPELAAEYGPPDHLCAQLRFIALLACREMFAAQAGDPAAAERLQGLQRSFFEEHLLRWAPAWCEQLAAASAHPFYAALGVLAAQGCRDAYEELAPLAAPA